MVRHRGVPGRRVLARPVPRGSDAERMVRHRGREQRARDPVVADGWGLGDHLDGAGGVLDRAPALDFEVLAGPRMQYRVTAGGVAVGAGRCGRETSVFIKVVWTP